MTHILMIAAENGALPGGKVGGIGDVIRDVPVALAKRKCRVTVLTPAYGSFSKLPGATKIKSLQVGFGGNQLPFDLYDLPAHATATGIHHIVVDHPLFSIRGAGQIYCNDLPDRPFATDASKFALLCACAAESMINAVFGNVDVIHLHDWHAAFLLILRQFDRRYQALQEIHCAYTIHNLSIQGIRPFAGDDSSLDSWYPDLIYEQELLADPRWTDCVNPMAVAIRLADRVHAVSPSYAEEIISPSDIDGQGFYGGEGLEADLREAAEQGRLFGILNGCEYPETMHSTTSGWKSLLSNIRDQLLLWTGTDKTSNKTHAIALSRLNQLDNNRPGMLLTSVGRITRQKIGLMIQPTRSGRPALDCILEDLDGQGLLLMIGNGDAALELFLTDVATRFDNFIFLHGYSEELADALYNLGDLFFMPSSYEPCGISQMLALRAGQPCLAHNVGGLRDTVEDSVTGFVFSGDNPTDKADNLVSTMHRALTLFQLNPTEWQALRQAAMAERFEWADSVDCYLKHLY